MFRTLALSLLLFCFCLGAPLFAADSVSGLEPAALAQALAKEPPLTAKDLDTFMKMMPDIQKAQNAADLAKLAKKNGLSNVRMDYILNKTMIGVQIMSGVPEENLKDVPGFIKPTDAEMALIKEYMKVAPAAK